MPPAEVQTSAPRARAGVRPGCRFPPRPGRGRTRRRPRRRCTGFRLPPAAGRARDLVLFEGRDDRDGVGRRNEHAEQQGGGDGPARPGRHARRDDQGRNDHAEGGQDQDRQGVPPQLAPVQGEGGLEQQRRQERLEDQVRRQGRAPADPRQRQADPGQDQADGVRQPQPPGDQGHQGGDQQQQDRAVNGQADGRVLLPPDGHSV